MAAARPDAFCPDLAASLTDLSALLAELGWEEALAAGHEAASINLELAIGWPINQVELVEHVVTRVR